MVPPYRLINSTRILIQRLMVVEGEHLCLLLILGLLVVRILGLLFILLLGFGLLPFFRLIVFLVEKSEVIGVLSFAIARVRIWAVVILFRCHFFLIIQF